MKTDSNPIANSQRYVQLDSLRGLAALTVFFSHAVNMQILSGNIYNAVNNSVLHMFWDGAAAVILFFVLSGFVLTLPFVGESNREPKYVPFIIKRVFRIYPAYWFALGFAILIKTLLFNKAGVMEFSALITEIWNWNLSGLTPGSLIKHAIMVGPGFERGQIDPVIWSLIVEMKVSLLFPFIILFVKELKTIKTGIMFLILSLALYKLGDYTVMGNLPFMKVEIFHYLPVFIAGALLAKFKTPVTDFIRKIPAALNVVIFIAAIFLYTSRFSLRSPQISYVNYDYIVALGVIILLALIVALPERFSLLTRRPMKFLGDISYSFYLLHFPILMVTTSIIYGRFQSIKLSIIVSLVASIIMSYLAYRFVEMPFQKAGHAMAKKAEALLASMTATIKAGFTRRVSHPTPDTNAHVELDVKQ